MVLLVCELSEDAGWARSRKRYVSERNGKPVCQSASQPSRPDGQRALAARLEPAAVDADNEGVLHMGVGLLVREAGR